VAQAVVLASREHLILDVIPANYVVVEGRAYYAGDEIAFGSRLADVGAALALPFAYADAFPNAVASYVERIEIQVRSTWTLADIERTGVGTIGEGVGSARTAAFFERIRRAFPRSRARPVATGAER